MLSQHTLDPHPLEVSRLSSGSGPNSTDSRSSTKSSTVDFLRHDSVPRGSHPHLGHLPGGRAGPGSPGSPVDLQCSGREGIMRSFMDSQPDLAEGGSAHATAAVPSSPDVSVEDRSEDCNPGPPTPPADVVSDGRHAASASMPRAQSTPCSEQLGPSSADAVSQETPAMLQRRRATCRLSHSGLQSAAPHRWHHGQPLIPIRSGEVELFVRQQPQRDPGAYPAPVPEQVKHQGIPLVFRRDTTRLVYCQICQSVPHAMPEHGGTVRSFCLNLSLLLTTLLYLSLSHPQI